MSKRLVLLVSAFVIGVGALQALLTTNTYAIDAGDLIDTCTKGETDCVYIKCDTLSTLRERQYCQALTQCAPDPDDQAALTGCSNAWNSCIKSYGTNVVDYPNCVTNIAARAFDKAVAPADLDTDVGSCRIGDGIGWIVCPILRFASNIVDGAYGQASKFLETAPVDPSADSSMYKAWSVMRNFANVLLVIAFIIIIYSQITGIGISNYGIKKLLPRIIIVAIILNLSYLLCQVAVDLSNISGKATYDLFQSLNAQLFDATKQTGTSWAAIFSSIVVGSSVAVYMLLSSFLPMLISALAAVVTAIVVFTLRNALLVILIVVSPIAIVAYLLPNTADWFHRWRKTFLALLVMYPAIGVLFGGAELAATIISNSSEEPLVQIVGAGVRVVPLILTPLLIKSSGAIGRLAGQLNNPNKGPFDRMRKGAENINKRQRDRQKLRAIRGGPVFGGALRRGMIRRGIKNKGIDHGMESALKRGEAEVISSSALRNKAFRNRLAGGQNLPGMRADDAEQNRALDSAMNIQAQLRIDEIKAASARIERATLDRSDTLQLARGGNPITLPDGSTMDAKQSLSLRQAAIQKVVATNDIKGINELVNDARSWSGEGAAELRRTLADSISSSNNKPAYLGQGKLDEIRRGANTQNADEIIESAIAANAYSPAKIAAADPDELEEVARINATSSTLSIAHKQRLIDNAFSASTDPRLATSISKNLDNVDHIIHNTHP